MCMGQLTLLCKLLKQGSFTCHFSWGYGAFNSQLISVKKDFLLALG